MDDFTAGWRAALDALRAHATAEGLSYAAALSAQIDAMPEPEKPVAVVKPKRARGAAES